MLRGLLTLRSDRNVGDPPVAPSADPGPPVRGDILDRVLVPVASERDAQRTAAALRPHLAPQDGSVVVVHVVERTRGWPDPTPPAEQVAGAERAFEAVTDGFEAAGVDVETRLLEGADVAEEILTAAADLEVGSIAFVRRGGSRLAKLLAGDVQRVLLERSECPVLVFGSGAGDPGAPGRQ